MIIIYIADLSQVLTKAELLIWVRLVKFEDAV